MGIGEDGTDLSFRIERCMHRGDLLLREASAYLGEPMRTSALTLDMDRTEQRKNAAAQVAARLAEAVQRDSDRAYKRAMGLLELQEAKKVPLPPSP